MAAAVLALSALGLSLVFGVMRVVNVAHGEFFMVGAMLAWWTAKMMPGGPLKRQQMTHLKIYGGASHPHDAQSPKPLDIKAMNPKNAVRG